jgi:hypothetical protein
LIIIPEIRGKNVSITFGFDVWAAGMSLLCIYDHINFSSDLYEEVDITDPDDSGDLMVVRNPIFENITSHEQLAQFSEIFRMIFEADPKKRATADFVMDAVVRLENNF